MSEPIRNFTYKGKPPTQGTSDTPLPVKLSAWFVALLVVILIGLLVTWGIIAVWSQIVELL